MFGGCELSELGTNEVWNGFWADWLGSHCRVVFGF